MKKPRRPSRLYVGPHVYQIRYHEGVLSNDSVGEFNRNTGVIDVDKSVMRSQEQETLVHEGLGHGIVADISYSFGPGDEPEEQFVAPFSNALLDVLQDPRNAPFFRYVMWRAEDDDD